jgi:ATP synthase protein I
MSQPDDESRRALERLNQRLEAFSSDRAPKRAAGEAESGVGEGYRMIAELIGGVLGGLGLGWVVDQFAHTRPFGMLIGLLAGTAASVYAVVKTASRPRRPRTPADDKEA